MQHILLDGQKVDYQLVRSKTAKKLRIKLKPSGIQIVVPIDREDKEAIAFLVEKRTWVLDQQARADQLRALRLPDKQTPGKLQFLGEPVPISLNQSNTWRAQNRVSFEGSYINIRINDNSSTHPAKSLENWLRKQARLRIKQYIAEVAPRINRSPNRVYVMDQRTKWGNCSALGNLSFNWRLVMAPEYVLRYIVTHEMVHLAIPDHSQRFWLTVQSLCPTSDRARQWLVANADRLMKVDCYSACGLSPHGV